MMNRRKNILIILFLSLSVLFLFFALYVFNVYGDLIEKKPENLFAEPSSTIKIQVVPINAFGWKIPFRKSTADFIITEGSALVKVVQINNAEGYIILRSLGVAGKVELNVKSEYSLLPCIIIIEILTLTG